jgi:hypothetical protein
MELSGKMNDPEAAPSSIVPESESKKERRQLSEKQIEALQRGREKRWKALHPDSPPAENPSLKRTFAMDAKDVERQEERMVYDSSSESEGWESPPTPPPRRSSKKLSKTLRRRLDQYIEEKMNAYRPTEDPYDEGPERETILDRMTPSAASYTTSVAPPSQQPYRFM